MTACHVVNTLVLVALKKKVSTRAHVLQFGILCRIFSMKLPSFFSFSFFNGIVDALLIFLWQNSIQLPMWKHVKNVSLLQVGRSTTHTYWCHICFQGSTTYPKFHIVPPYLIWSQILVQYFSILLFNKTYLFCISVFYCTKIYTKQKLCWNTQS